VIRIASTITRLPVRLWRLFVEPPSAIQGAEQRRQARLLSGLVLLLLFLGLISEALWIQTDPTGLRRMADQIIALGALLGLTLAMPSAGLHAIGLAPP
jgi:hypothetical protein